MSGPCTSTRAPVHDLVFAGDFRRCRGGPRGRRLPARAARLLRVELLRPSRAHPEIAHGRTVLAATVRVGRGRIAAFTDSTVWSSFAVFSHDREKLAMDLVRMLNREPSPYTPPIRGLAVVAALMALVVGWKTMCSGLALPAVLFGLVGLWSGLATVGGPASPDLCLAGAERSRSPRSRSSGRAAPARSRRCSGRPTRVPADRSYDTLLVATQRLGLVPRVAFTYDDLLQPETRAWSRSRR